ncbi:ABC transporter permease [Krasilnikovia sp. MM14-A1004]|uniref:ABC transporter permease n=1 Tax=Krasilnikovia sp. MM14-A1004 TaxID=3373541 RepID=UPI00399CF507
MTRAGRWLADHLVLGIGLLVLAYLLLPIAVIVALSFYRPTSRLSYDFGTFTLDYWRNPCGAPGMCASLVRSVQIGFAATVVATVLGTLMAFALTRYRFRGRSATGALVFLPMATPEVVMGSSLLALFAAARIPLGFWTVVIAHVMFCVSFVVVTVRARLATLDPRLPEAAADLYAGPWAAFRRVILPLALPGIVAAALLAFSLSFDDFIVTNFTAGTTTTFPMYIWGAAQRGIPPQVNVIATVLFGVSLLAVLAATVRRRQRS